MRVVLLDDDDDGGDDDDDDVSGGSRSRHAMRRDGVGAAAGVKLGKNRFQLGRKSRRVTL